MRSGMMVKDWMHLVSGLIRSLANVPNPWEASIRDFERQDTLQPPDGNAIVFVGSSTFTFWKTLERDMLPLKVVNRGFGGAKLADIAHNFERTVLPCKPKNIVTIQPI